MVPAARYTLAAASITLALAGCQDVTGPNDRAGPLGTGPMMSRAAESTAPLIQYIVAPQATDDRTDRALANHYVRLDTAARPNHNLCLFLPNRRTAPDTFQRVVPEPS